MKTRIGCLLGVVLLGLQGCCFQAKHRTTADQRYIPEGLGGSLPPSDRSLGDPIRYDALYVITSKMPDGTSHVGWYRFWPGGQVLYKDVHGPDAALPTARDGDDFSRGQVGRYSAVGREVTLEFWSHFNECWRFFTVSGQVRGDGGINMTRRQWQGNRPWMLWPMRDAPKAINAPLDLHPVGPMHRQPDW